MTPSQSAQNYTPHPPEDYDANISGIIPYYSAIHQEIINLVKSLPSNPKVWLDTGCGTGSLVNKAIKEFPDTKFLLVDPSEGMLDQSRQKLVFTSYPKARILKRLCYPGGLSGIKGKARYYHSHTVPSLP